MPLNKETQTQIIQNAFSNATDFGTLIDNKTSGPAQRPNSKHKVFSDKDLYRLWSVICNIVAASQHQWSSCDFSHISVT